MRRRRSRRHLGGMAPDTVVGLTMLVAGVGLAYILWKKNTPSPAELEAALKLRDGKGVAGLGDCGCGK
jgi:hypothetical protein